MPWYVWMGLGGIAIMVIIAFCICCPDLLPWNRRKYK